MQQNVPFVMVHGMRERVIARNPSRMPGRNPNGKIGKIGKTRQVGPPADRPADPPPGIGKMQQLPIQIRISNNRSRKAREAKEKGRAKKEAKQVFYRLRVDRWINRLLFRKKMVLYHGHRWILHSLCHPLHSLPVHSLL